MTHLESFARAPAIAFDLGENDLHINADNAIAFKAALAADHPEAADQVQIHIHPGLDHLGAGRDRRVEDVCFDWLTAETAVAAPAFSPERAGPRLSTPEWRQYSQSPRKPWRATE
jgi:dienelactone hydrolase